MHTYTYGSPVAAPRESKSLVSEAKSFVGKEWSCGEDQVEGSSAPSDVLCSDQKAGISETILVREL